MKFVVYYEKMSIGQCFDGEVKKDGGPQVNREECANKSRASVIPLANTKADMHQGARPQKHYPFSFLVIMPLNDSFVFLNDQRQKIFWTLSVKLQLGTRIRVIEFTC